MVTEHHHPLIACEHCGGINHMLPLAPGETSVCPRCESTLWRASRLSASHWLAISVAALITFAVANAFPVARMSVQGMTSDATLLDAVGITWRQGKVPVSIMCLLAGFALPLIQLLLQIWVLVPLSRGKQGWGFRTLVRLLAVVEPWCMVPVFLLGVVVAVVKLAGMASVTPEIGLLAFGVLVALLTVLSRLSSHLLWHLAETSAATPVESVRAGPGEVLAGCGICGQVQPLMADEAPDTPHRCVRCNAVVHLRKPDSVSRTWALLIAAVILYIPANLLPVMTISSLLGDSAHTILGGVIELWTMGSWDIALIVFVASVVVPLVKMLSLGVLVWRLQRASPESLKPRTRLYEFVEVIGQWSMLDVFVVILLAALADFQGLMEISAGGGAAAFGGVVILTMLAAMSFDPRQAWDAEHAAPEAAAQAAPREAHAGSVH